MNHESALMLGVALDGDRSPVTPVSARDAVVEPWPGIRLEWSTGRESRSPEATRAPDDSDMRIRSGIRNSDR